jgi:hypothetical protein
MKINITAMTAATLALVSANAEDRPPGPPPGGGAGGPRPNPEEVFKKLDANGDGSVSLEEFKAGPRAPKEADKAQEVFSKIDKDGSGGISLEEFKAHRPPHGPGGGRPGGPGGGVDAGGGGTGPGGASPGGGPGGGGNRPRRGGPQN